MRIVITDGDTLNPGDLDWSPLESLGEIQYYGYTAAQDTVERCKGAEVVITNKTIISREVIEAAEHLKMIAVSATGYNNVDLAAASARGIVVSNVPEYGTYSVAQHCFALLLELVNHVGANAASVRNNGWAENGSWSYTLRPITELKDKKLGIVGMGRIGSQVARIAQGFGMEIIFQNRSQKKFEGARQVDMATLFGESDVVSLHCPLTEENKGFVNTSLLAMMKRNAILLNTSRGALINEDDLLAALESGRIAGAGLDVLVSEPPAKNHPLAMHKNCLVTPHTAWLSVEARGRLMQQTIKNIEAYVHGQPINQVKAL